MRILAILLSLILSLPGGALRMSADVYSSQVLSVEALDGLNALLWDSSLLISPEGYDLTLGGQLLLWARENFFLTGL